MAFRLRDNLFACCVQGRAVFLDVDANRFFCLPLRADAAFRALLSAGDVDDVDLAALAPLTHSGLLIDSPVRLSGPLDTRGHQASDAGAGAFRAGSGRLRDLLLAVRCQTLCAIMLRQRSFAGSIDWLRRNKFAESDEIEGDIDARLQSLQVAFAKTSLLFPPADRCFGRSVAFMTACIRRRIAATLVLGVQLNPFRAHCWVERNDQAIFDDLREAPHFTAIHYV